MNKTIKLPKFKGSASLDKRKARAGWIFVLPFVLGILLLYLPILINSVLLSFNDLQYSRDGTTSLAFMGMKYYQDAFLVDADFKKKLVEGIQQLIFEIPAIVVFSLFIAVILNQKMVGRAAFRAIFFIPVILSTGLMDEVASLEEEVGGQIDTGTGQSATNEIISVMDIEALFSDMKVGTGLVQYVVDLVNKIYDLINRSGVQMLIFLAGLQSISPAIYEACDIEGATSWETFWKITFPMISPMILVNSVYTIIDSFTSKSNIVMEYIAGKTAGGLSTAMSWIYFLVVMAIIGVVALIASSFVFYQKRD